MKKLILQLFISTTVFGLYAQSESPILFRDLSFLDALESSRFENKKGVFIDFYADWCGPCKYMDKYVFTEQTVADFYNTNFVSIKIDTDSGEEYELIESLGFTGIPTYAFFDHDGSLTFQRSGAMDATKFLDLGKIVNSRSALLESQIDLDAHTDKALILELIAHEDPSKAYDIAIRYVDRMIAADPYLAEAGQAEWELIYQYVTKNWEESSWSSPIAFLDSVDLHLLINAQTICENSWLDPQIYYYFETLEYYFNYLVETGETDKMDLYQKAYSDFQTVIDEASFPASSYDDYTWIKYHTLRGNVDYFFENSEQWLQTYHLGDDYYYRELGAMLSASCEEDRCRDRSEQLFLNSIQINDNDINNLMLAAHYYNSGQSERLKPLLDRAEMEFQQSEYYYMFEFWRDNPLSD